MSKAGVYVNGDVNGKHKNTVESSDRHEDVAPLHVSIIGAGIGGLTAAIALRREGHHVTLLEQRSEANETGAAIHLAPNCNGVLRRLGLFPERFGANKLRRITEYGADGSLTRSIDAEKTEGMWQHEWLLCHRAKLHQNLTQAALDEKAEIRYSSRVDSIDPSTGTITLTDGTSLSGDVLIGADGVSSITRRAVKNGDKKPFSSGKSAFRFLVSRKQVLEDQRTKNYAENNGEMILALANDRRVVVYPCEHDKLLNFVCIHPSAETEVSTDDWSVGGNKEKLLEVYAGWDDSLKALLEMADSATLKVWSLLDMEKLPTWTNERLALLGDAAHPFLPHQGQGGAQAIEDGIALAVMLPRGTRPDEVPERLGVYEKARYERAHRIQEYTRISGLDLDSGKQINMMEFSAYNFGHDEYDHSTKVFDEYRYAKNPNLYWRMPVSFGPAPGPRQALYTNAAQRALHSTFTTASIKFKTSRTFLQNLLPTAQFSYKSPGTVAHASISQTTLSGMEWLGGSGYRHFGLYLHGVTYTKRDGSVVNGTYLPLLFESLADPIVSGRDELGMPKVFCEIDVRRREHSYSVRTSWQGATFGFFDLDGLDEADSAAEAGTIGGEADYGILTYKYVPSVGERGKVDAAYAVVVPHEEEAKMVKSSVHRAWRAKAPKFRFDSLTRGDLPTLHHIVSKLEQMPVYEFLSGKVVEGTGVPDVSAARRIEPES